MSTELVESIAQLRNRLAPARRSGAHAAAGSEVILGLVPTMGALHAGHVRLIEQARRECGCVAVSVFVNPTQFDREDDIAGYPRTIEADVEVCAALGVDVVFAPAVSQMYPSPAACGVDVGRMADHLCGRHRPGHFRAVATVVMKLFQIALPDRAYFGEKDAQQLAIVRRMVADLNVPVTIVGVPTVREPDGLALSSRNRRLSPAERRLAPLLYRALQEAERQIAGGMADAGAVKQAAEAQVPQNEALKIEYLEVVDEQDMQPVERITGPVVVAGAVWVGAVRLIDNVRCGPRPL